LNSFKAASFADGTKLSLECCVLANATGFRVGRMGMYGPSCAHVREMAGRLPSEQLLSGGLVDYALAAEPTSGVFVIAHVPDAAIRKDLAYFKLGDGPFHVFVSPFHLPSAQIASSIARAVLSNSATVAPRGAPVCEVAAVAKRDLQAGEVLDGVGGYCAYGSIENAPVFAEQGFLSVGVSEGCRLVRSVRKDTPVRYDDVELPKGRLCDRLVCRQTAMVSAAHLHPTGVSASNL
jgi:predicted homoserine dehydrogenase-like protein